MASADSGQQPPAEWHVESHSAWIAPASKLEMRVPVIDHARFLYLDFEVLQGRWINFDVWLEHPDDQSAIRLYGPSHRSSSVCTVFPVPNPGTAFVTFDNISSWMTSVQIRYTLRLSSEESTERTSTTFARLRAGYMIGRDSVQSEEEAAEEMAEELLARRALELAKPQEMLIAAGAQEEVELRVDSPNTHMYVSVDVVRGRDIDFGVVLLPDSSSSSSGGESADVDPTPLTLFGPCRRAASISANVLVPSSGIVVLGFDNSGTWFSSKTVRFRARVNDADGGGSKCVSGVTDL